jgi:hypothetical protein
VLRSVKHVETNVKNMITITVKNVQMPASNAQKNVRKSHKIKFRQARSFKI